MQLLGACAMPPPHIAKGLHGRARPGRARPGLLARFLCSARALLTARLTAAWLVSSQCTRAYVQQLAILMAATVLRLIHNDEVGEGARLQQLEDRLERLNVQIRQPQPCAVATPSLQWPPRSRAHARGCGDKQTSAASWCGECWGGDAVAAPTRAAGAASRALDGPRVRETSSDSIRHARRGRPCGCSAGERRHLTGRTGTAGRAARRAARPPRRPPPPPRRPARSTRSGASRPGRARPCRAPRPARPAPGARGGRRPAGTPCRTPARGAPPPARRRRGGGASAAPGGRTLQELGGVEGGN